MAGNLDAKTVEAAKRRAAPYRLSDGGGLLLEVRPSGARMWLVRLTVAGKRRDLGLGGYPGVSLKEAREKAAAARKIAAGGRKQPSLPWARLPAFMVALDAMPGLGALALRLVVLTALRSGEVRNARWSWLSFDGAPTLTVPGEVMKGKKTGEVLPHRVPLSDAALETLARAYAEANGTAATTADLSRLAALARDTLIFPSAKRTTPLSDMALSAVMRRMNADKPDEMPAPWRDADGRLAVPHGFRATFSTWVDDTRPHEREAAEKALAHEVANKVSGAYRRSDLFDRRQPLMRDWAEHCDAGAKRRRGTRTAA